MFKQEGIVNYYSETSDAYLRWGGGGGAIHFGFHPNPSEPLDHLDSLERLTDEILRFAGVDPKDTVLDSGCGMGAVSIKLASKCRYVVGINISPGQIVEATKKVREKKLEDKVFILQQDYSNMEDIENELFDLGLMVESLFHSNDKQAVSLAHHRVLKNNGKFVVADYFIKREMSGGETDLLRVFEEGWVGKLVSVDNIRNILAETGFSNAEILELSENMLPSIKIASESALGHNTDIEVSDIRKRHREATVAFYKLIESGALGYFFIKATK